MSAPLPRNLPNLLTLMRLALAPAIAVLIVEGHARAAFAAFVLSAASDLADGFLARRWGAGTRWGAAADPVADKLSMLAVVVPLALAGDAPWWLAAAILARDAMIVGGVLAWRAFIGAIDIAPSRLSKLNTGLEFTTLLALLGAQAGWVGGGAWLQALTAATLATIVLSGLQYLARGLAGAAHARRGP
jgi:cardiolipin synthase